jgi:hypothetical protein
MDFRGACLYELAQLRFAGDNSATGVRSVDPPGQGRQQCTTRARTCAVAVRRAANAVHSRFVPISFTNTQPIGSSAEEGRRAACPSSAVGKKAGPRAQCCGNGNADPARTKAGS